MAKAAAKSTNPKSNEAVGERLRALRVSVTDNQSEFCRRVGIASNTWNQYEKAVSRPDLDRATQIVQTFGVTLDWIYLGDPSGLPHQLAVRIAAARPDVDEGGVGRGPIPGEGEPHERIGERGQG